MVTDHLAALFFSPADVGSRGTYTPGRFDLHLRGGQDVADQLVHHHEAQHVLLTATTAWGGALLAAAGMPAWERLFDQLLDRCRSTHESFATYLSCSVVSVGLGSPELALVADPAYVALVERMERYLAAVPGAHRRALAATALARVCMQTPILLHMVGSWPSAITVGSLRRLDVPDERLEYLLRDPEGLPATVVAVADEAVAERFGTAPLNADLAGGSAALDDKFDTAWARWEETIFASLAGRLTDAGATVLSANGHLAAAAELAALAARTDSTLRLAIEPNADASDQRVVGIVLSHARLWLAALRRPARMITVGHDVDLDEVVRVADATSRIAGRPNLVLSARLPDRLLAGYDFPERDGTSLAALQGPVVGVRSIADDGAGTETDAVWLARLPEPADAAALAAAWTGVGDLSCCVAASCLADARWRDAWLYVLEKIGPMVWLIDVGIGVLADELGGGRTVHGMYLDLGPSPTGARRAVAFKVDGLVGVWLAVADDVGIQMITEQIADLPGIDLRMTGTDWSELLPAVRLVVLDLLHIESYVDLRALSDRWS